MSPLNVPRIPKLTNFFYVEKIVITGGQTNCDHWHDGAGFVTSHVAISLMFEQSLQAVNPSIALPYWDFTIEGTAHDWTDFRDGQVFSDDWFGNAAPPNVSDERARKKLRLLLS